MGFILLLGSCPAFAQSGGGYDLGWNTFDGGGWMWSTGGAFELGGTSGQPDAGPVLAGGGYTVTGGFWVGAPPPCSVHAPADFDQDCDVDTDDFTAMKACASGARVAYAAGCASRDLDGDGDVDMDDFARLQRCFSGAGRVAPAGCAG